MDFSRRTIRFELLGSRDQPLQQLAAGHFFLRLLPADGKWPGMDPQKWRRVGVGGIMELQVPQTVWWRHKLHRSGSLRLDLDSKHEHFLTESSLKIGHLVCDVSVQEMAQPVKGLSRPDPSVSVSSRVRPHGGGGRAHQESPAPVESSVHKALCKTTMAPKWAAALAFAATMSLVLPVSVPIGQHHGAVGGTSKSYDCLTTVVIWRRLAKTRPSLPRT